jgi:hypothetical protein
MMTDRPGKDEQHPPELPPEPEGNSLQDASDEAVRFLEQDDETGHAGRGDYG